MAFALLIALKLGFLWAFGPTLMGDAGVYIDYADAILSGRVNAPELLDLAFPVTLFRIAGYPTLIAGAKLLAAAAAVPWVWPWLLVGLQFAVSLCATAAIYRLAGKLGLGRWGALFVAGAQATSLPLAIDQAILTDSLDASLLTLAGCGLAAAVLDRRKLAIGLNLAVGLALAGSFLLREATSFLALAFVPLALAAACAGGNSWRRAALSMLLTFGPLLATDELYKAWSYERTGSWFVTTGAQRHLLDGLIKSSQFDPQIFSGDTPLDQVARRVTHDYSLDEAARASDVLFHDYGRSAIEIADDVYAAYFRAWREHPGAMLRTPFLYLKEWQAKLTVQPMESVRLLLLWNTGNDWDFGIERSMAGGRWWTAPAFVLRRLTEAVAIVVFAGFLLLTPWRALRERWRAPDVVAATALWLLYLGNVAAYAVVYLEPRYLAPVVPWSIVVGVANLAWLWNHAPLRAHRRQPAPSAGA